MKKSPLKRKTPLKRSKHGLKRNNSLKATPMLSDKSLRRNAYLSAFRGIPCEYCGRTSWAGQRTTAHHILKAELYPEYYFEDMNCIVLCPKHHIPFAHDREKEFLGWLKKYDPERWAWQDNRRNKLNFTGEAEEKQGAHK